jgi:hypothetical protein
MESKKFEEEKERYGPRGELQDRGCLDLGLRIGPKGGSSSRGRDGVMK